MMVIGALAGLMLAMVPTATVAAGIEATVQWSKPLALVTCCSGVIARVSVQPGERVGADQVLLALEETPFASAVRSTEAIVARRRLELEEAARDFRQARELYERKVLSTVELENARMKSGRADASLKEAQAELERARFRLRHSALRAPYPAVVLARQAEPGQVVNADVPGPPLLVLAAADEYVARARLAPDRALALKPDQNLAVTAAGRTFKGLVRSIAFDPRAAQDNQATLEVAFAAPGVSLYPGQAARIELP